MSTQVGDVASGVFVGANSMESVGSATAYPFSWLNFAASSRSIWLYSSLLGLFLAKS
jgi:hypothetical protein